MAKEITVAYLVSNAGHITVYLNNKVFHVPADHPNYLKVKAALKEKQYSNLPKLLEIGKEVVHYSKGKIEVRGNSVYYNNAPLHHVVVNRILDLRRDGFAFENMVKFLENLMANPNQNSRRQLYSFLENKNLPITDNGCFLAYKSVRSDMYDKHSRTIKNEVGKVITVDRSKVDDNPDNHCSHGLHVGALEYSGPNGWFHNSGDVVIVVEVNPRDAVSVPNDHNCQKMRVCEYKVVGLFDEEVGKKMEKAYATPYSHDEEDKEALEDAYEEGYDDGYNCRDISNPYKDYDLSQEYSKGYDDGESERAEEDDDDDIEEVDEWDDEDDYEEDDYEEDNSKEEYDTGYDEGYSDREQGNRKRNPYNRVTEANYCDGYEEGYFDAECDLGKVKHSKRDSRGRFCK